MKLDQAHLTLLHSLQFRQRMPIKISRHEKHILTTLVDARVLQGWVVRRAVSPIKRTVLVWSQTNPREPDVLKFLIKHPENDLLCGITGQFSLFGRFRPVGDRGILEIQKDLESQMLARYRMVEVLEILKEDGFVVPEQYRQGIQKNLSRIEENTLEVITKLGKEAFFPPKIAEIATAVERKPVTIHRILKKLSSHGIIRGYSIKVNQNVLPHRIRFLVRIKPHSGSEIQSRSTINKMVQIPNHR